MGDQGEGQRWTGIPVSVGIAPTKTLAKIANHMAKKGAGVCALIENIDPLLKRFPIGEVWGVGRQLERFYKMHGMMSALDLKEVSDQWLKKQKSVMALRTAWELRGISCLEADDVDTPKQSMTYSRTFQTRITDQKDLAQILSNFAARACARARDERSLVSFLTFYIMTSPHDNDFYHNHLTLTFPQPTSYTPTLTKALRQALPRIFRNGLKYKKAGVILGGLIADASHQADLFTPRLSAAQERAHAALDKINIRYGDQLVHFASEGISTPTSQSKSNHHSPRYTTDWGEILKVRI